MNLAENYDAVEGKGKVKVEPRAIRMGDVLREVGGLHYLIVSTNYDDVCLVGLTDGNRWPNPTTVVRRTSLTREEAATLCGNKLGQFALVGPARNVLKVQDPED